MDGQLTNENDGYNNDDDDSDDDDNDDNYDIRDDYRPPESHLFMI